MIAVNSKIEAFVGIAPQEPTLLSLDQQYVLFVKLDISHFPVRQYAISVYLELFQHPMARQCAQVVLRDSTVIRTCLLSAWRVLLVVSLQRSECPFVSIVRLELFQESMLHHA